MEVHLGMREKVTLSRPLNKIIFSVSLIIPITKFAYKILQIPPETYLIWGEA